MTLSNTAKDFRLAYTQYVITEALSTTSKEDEANVIATLEQGMLMTPFKVLMDMAIEDNFIDSYDEVYTVKG